MTGIQFFRYLFFSDLCNLIQILNARLDFCSILIQKFKSQSLQHSHAAVCGGAASDPYDKLSASSLYSVQDHFTDAVCGCICRIQFFFVHQGNSRCFCHFQDCQLFFLHDPIFGVYLFPKGSCHLCLYHLSSKPGDQGCHSPFAAVCHWFYCNLQRWVSWFPHFLFCLPDAFLCRISGF